MDLSTSKTLISPLACLPMASGVFDVYLRCITKDIISFYSLMVKCIFSSSLLMSGEPYIRVMWWICLYYCEPLVYIIVCVKCAVMNLPLLLCVLNVLWWYYIGLVVKIRLRVIHCVTIKKLMIFSLCILPVCNETHVLVSLSIAHH